MPKNSPVARLVDDLQETMLLANGIGLAAPQVGLRQRVIVVRTETAVLGFINPVIVQSSRRKVTGEEGCLSIPGVFGLVKRPQKIRVEAKSATGETLEFTADGLFARVIQHEIDHLNGVLFIDRLQKLTAGEDRLRELWRARSA